MCLYSILVSAKIIQNQKNWKNVIKNSSVTSESTPLSVLKDIDLTLEGVTVLLAASSCPRLGVMGEKLIPVLRRYPRFAVSTTGLAEGLLLSRSLYRLANVQELLVLVSWGLRSQDTTNLSSVELLGLALVRLSHGYLLVFLWLWCFHLFLGVLTDSPV